MTCSASRTVRRTISPADSTVRIKPALTPALYEQTFRDGRFFVAREVECRTMGAKACRFVAERL